MAAKLGVDVM